MLTSSPAATLASLLGRTVIAVSLAVAGCGRGTPPPPQTGPATAGPRTIEVVNVIEEPVDLTLSLPAELAAFQQVEIYARATGFVATVAVDRGSVVRAGQVLATLEAPELAAQRAEAQSKVQGAEAQLAAARSKADASVSTYEKLKAASVTPGVVAGNELVVAQRAMEADASQIAAAQQNVEAARQVLAAVRDMEGYLTITAPFDGVITERNVHPGALVGPAAGARSTTPMLRLVQGRRLRLVVAVPEAYVAGVVTGTSMPFAVAAYPGHAFTGMVARIAHVVDVQTRTMAVELDVDNADGRLSPGTFCQVQWPVHRTGPSLLVPSGSVATTTGRTFVVRVRNGHAEWVDVNTGFTAGRMVEVFGALQAGDVVAARGTDEIQSGSEVRAMAARSPTS